MAYLNNLPLVAQSPARHGNEVPNGVGHVIHRVEGVAVGLLAVTGEQNDLGDVFCVAGGHEVGAVARHYYMRSPLQRPAHYRPQPLPGRAWAVDTGVSYYNRVEIASIVVRHHAPFGLGDGEAKRAEGTLGVGGKVRRRWQASRRQRVVGMLRAQVGGSATDTDQLCRLADHRGGHVAQTAVHADHQIVAQALEVALQRSQIERVPVQMVAYRRHVIHFV